MFKIEAYLRPSALEGVQKGLGEIGIVGMSVTEIRGFGRQRGHRGARAAARGRPPRSRCRLPRPRCRPP